MYNTIAEALHMACIYYFQSVVPVIYGCRVSGSRSSILTLLSKAPLIIKDVCIYSYPKQTKACAQDDTSHHLVIRFY